MPANNDNFNDPNQGKNGQQPANQAANEERKTTNKLLCNILEEIKEQTGEITTLASLQQDSLGELGTIRETLEEIYEIEYIRARRDGILRTRREKIFGGITDSFKSISGFADDVTIAFKKATGQENKLRDEELRREQWKETRYQSGLLHDIADNTGGYGGGRRGGRGAPPGVPLGPDGLPLGKFGSFVASLKGILLKGAAAVGIGAIIGGLGFLFGKLGGGKFDAETLKKNVVTLFSIPEAIGYEPGGGLIGAFGFFAEKGLLIAVLGNMGLALAALAVGGGLTKMWIGDTEWPCTIKENIMTLFSIPGAVVGHQGWDHMIKFFGDGATLFLVLSGLAVGLTAFAISGLAARLFLGGGEWADNVAYSVNALLSIPEQANATGIWGSTRMITFSTVAFPLIMAGLGAGLTAFAPGGLLNRLFDGDGSWADNVAYSVKALLSIPQELGKTAIGTMWASGMIGVALGALGVGLSAFGLGTGSNRIGQMFGKDSKWAENIKENVKILLQIPAYAMGESSWWGEALWKNLKMTGRGGALGLALGQIGIGLTSFGFGAAINRWAQTKGTEKNWAEAIKDNVASLFSMLDVIGTDEIVTRAKLLGEVLGYISSGLGSFGWGSALDNLVSSLTKTEQHDWIQTIRDYVEMLTSVFNDDGVTLARSREFLEITDNFGKSLSTFNSYEWGKLGSGLAKVVNSTIGFFAGRSSLEKDIGRISKLGESIEKVPDKLERVTEALIKFADAMTKINDRKSTSMFDFASYFRNVSDALPYLDAMARGSAYGWGKNKVDFRLLDKIDANAVIDRIQKLKSMLGDDPIVVRASVGSVNGTLTQTAQQIDSSNKGQAANRDHHPPVIAPVTNNQDNSVSSQVSNSFTQVTTGPSTGEIISYASGFA